MSDRKGRDYYPSEPSSSSGKRGSSSSSHSKRLPYARPSEHDRGHSSKSVVKTADQSSRHDDTTSTPSSSRQHASERMEVETPDSQSRDAQRRGRVSKDIVFVTKPSDLVTKKGRSGRPITLQTNYFKLLTIPNWRLYKYRVDFEPEEARTAVRKGLLKIHKEKIPPYIFDGTVMYTSTPLPNELKFVSDRKSDETKIKINIRLVGEMIPTDPHYIQFFNVTMRKCLEYLQLQLIGRNYFDTHSKVDIREFKLELWPGYVTSIRQHEYNILMCTEITHKVMHNDTLLHVLDGVYNRDPYNFKAEFSKSVIGLTVLTDYNNNTYRIEDVDFDVTPASTFTLKSGENISYRDYYKNKYNIVIKNFTQPMLVTRSKPKIRSAGQGELVYLVPELCRTCGLSDRMKENFQLMRSLATHTRVSPDSRVDKLMAFNRRLRQEPKIVKELKDWNMELDRNLVEVPARILSPETLILGNNSTLNSGRGDWTRDMQRARLFHTKELRNWIVVGTERDRHSVQGFLDSLMRASYGLAFRIEPPRFHWLPNDKSNTYAENIEYICSKSTPEMFLCIVSNNRIDRYAAIKKKCCIDRPTPSQVILQKNLQARNVMSIATKVAIQMNCKLGGAAWSIQVPLRGLMAIGFDNCRGANTRGKDFLAMVATIDSSLTNYYSVVTAYHSNEELLEQISASVCKAIQAYRERNKSLPMHIVIYRDGISEGQVQFVFENEVDSLKKQLEKTYYGPNFKLTFIIVSKRINTRFFCNKRNPEVGTVIDDVVTSPFKYDFFIVSQQVRQGTIAPTSYSIISDNSGADIDLIQQTTYKLTHMYYNCSTTVRVPAPCHYAQKLSTLAGRVLYRPPGTGLENRLFFL